jgi:thioredoxin 1
MNAIVNNNFLELNEANFHREVLGAPQPVLVEFWAGWSEASKAMAPLLEAVAKDDAFPVKIFRVNVEHHENLTDQYGVRAVPTLLLFNQGTVKDQIVGRTTAEAVCERLEKVAALEITQTNKTP